MVDINPNKRQYVSVITKRQRKVDETYLGYDEKYTEHYFINVDLLYLWGLQRPGII